MTIALLWLVHPLQTESVTYIVQRCEALMGMFFLLTIYSYLRGATSLRPWRWYSLGFVTYCLGLASKEVMVTVLPVLWLYDRCFLAASWREVLQRRGVLHAAFLVPVVVAAVVFVPGMLRGANSTAGFGVQSVTPWEYARSQPGVILHYLRLCVWPHPQCLDYGWPVETRWLLGILLPSLVIGGLLALSVWSLLRGQPIGFLGVAFFLILAPTSSCMPIKDLCFEHRMYVPSMAVAAAVVWGVYHVPQRLLARRSEFRTSGRRVLLGLGLACALALACLTHLRNRVYADPLVFWQDVVEQAPHNARAHNNLGLALAGVGRFQEAVVHYERALRLKPEFVSARNNLGIALARLGQLPQAVIHLERALEGNPDYWSAHSNLGRVLAKSDRWEEALSHFSRALELDPTCAETRTDMAAGWMQLGRFAEAAECCRSALRQQPDSAELHLKLTYPLLKLGLTDEAIAHYQQALRIRPDDPLAHYNLGSVLAGRGQFGKAIVHFQQAVALKPDYRNAHVNLARALASCGQRDAAMAQFRKVLDDNPDDGEVQQELIRALSQQKRLHDELTSPSSRGHAALTPLRSR